MRLSVRYTQSSVKCTDFNVLGCCGSIIHTCISKYCLLDIMGSKKYDCMCFVFKAGMPFYMALMHVIIYCELI